MICAFEKLIQMQKVIKGTAWQFTPKFASIFKTSKPANQGKLNDRVEKKE